jgi:hypothetical protein
MNTLRRERIECCPLSAILTHGRRERRARKMQRPQSQHDDLARLSRTRSSQSGRRRLPAARTVNWNRAGLTPLPHGMKVSLAAETESPGVGPPEMT